MTPENVRERIKAVKALIDDDERAHAEEDELHRDILRAIANGRCSNPTMCVSTALETLDLDFNRWCA